MSKSESTSELRVVEGQRSLSEFGSVRDRVRKRVSVLKEWLAKGVPQSYVGRIPRSLREAKSWHDEELGIYSIRSPNDFTKSHPVWGREVATVAELLTQVVRRYSVARTPRGTRSNAAAMRAEATLLRGQSQELASQYHAARAEAVAERVRADAEAAKCVRLSEALAERDRELAELRRRLSHDGSHLRKVD